MGKYPQFSYANIKNGIPFYREWTVALDEMDLNQDGKLKILIETIKFLRFTVRVMPKRSKSSDQYEFMRGVQKWQDSQGMDIEHAIYQLEEAISTDCVLKNQKSELRNQKSD